MQTFLPYTDFAKSAKCLDNKRLGKQRVEAWQIYKALTTEKYGWKNHPIVKMWKGYEKCLLLYGIAISTEWHNRGFKDTMCERFWDEYIKIKKDKDNVEKPIWLYDESFLSSHRSNLLRKNPVWYEKFGWKEPKNLPYKWAVKSS